LKTCVRCPMEFEESEVDVVGVSPATELWDYLDSRFRDCVVIGQNVIPNPDLSG